MPEPGDSTEQRESEPFLLAAVSKIVGCELRERQFPLPNGGSISLDGCNGEATVLCEAWAHQGPPRGSQFDKVMTDAAKLFLAGSLIETPSRKLLAFADADAARPFEGRSWMAQALQLMGVEILVVEIPEEVRARIRAAQIRQFR